MTVIQSKVFKLGGIVAAIGAVGLMLGLAGCATGVPKNVEPVSEFEIDRYLGKWYEIARLDHRFERGLTNVTAQYSNTDDGIRVLNKGYNKDESKWEEAEGKAKFAEDPDTGYLEVSFFGPFYGSYVIFALDKERYQYAMVSGPDTSYLWILAREPQLQASTLEVLLAKAKSAGFATEELIWVPHDK